MLVAFDGLEAFGPELIERAATGQPTEEDWATADAFCEQLLLQTLPFSANLADLGYLADIQTGYAWDEFDGTVDPEAGYFFACVAVGPRRRTTCWSATSSRARRPRRHPLTERDSGVTAAPLSHS